MPGQPAPGATTTYTFDFTSLTIAEVGASPQPPSNIVDKNDTILIRGTCVFGGPGAAGIVGLLASAGANLRMVVKAEGWGSDPEGTIGAPVLVPLVAGQTTYTLTLTHGMAGSFMPADSLYELRASITLTPTSAATLGIAGYNSIPALQVIAAAP